MTLPIRKTLIAAVLGLTLSPMAMALPSVHILASGGGGLPFSYCVLVTGCCACPGRDPAPSPGYP